MVGDQRSFEPRKSGSQTVGCKRSNNANFEQGLNLDIAASSARIDSEQKLAHAVKRMESEGSISHIRGLSSPSTSVRNTVKKLGTEIKRAEIERQQININKLKTQSNKLAIMLKEKKLHTKD